MFKNIQRMIPRKEFPKHCKTVFLPERSLQQLQQCYIRKWTKKRFYNFSKEDFCEKIPLKGFGMKIQFLQIIMFSKQ